MIHVSGGWLRVLGWTSARRGGWGVCSALAIGLLAVQGGASGHAIAAWGAGGGAGGDAGAGRGGMPAEAWLATMPGTSASEGSGPLEPGGVELTGLDPEGKGSGDGEGAPDDERGDERGGAEEPRRRVAHPLGLSVVLLEGWRAEQGLGAVRLRPGNGRGESYLLMVEHAGGAGRIDDPALLRTLTRLVETNFPNLTREWGPMPVTHGEVGGIRLSWGGRPYAGAEVLSVELYAVLHEDEAWLLLAAASPSQMRTRRADLEAMLASLKHGDPTLDSELVGEWVREVGGDDGATVRYALRDDGTFREREGEGDSGEVRARGRWAASEGYFYLMWDEGSSEALRYRVSDDALVITRSRRWEETWTRAGADEVEGESEGGSSGGGGDGGE